MSLALTARRAVLSPGQWVRNDLWRRGSAGPSLDLRFADNKSLVDSATGQSLVTFTRASSGTFVDSAGVIQTAVTDEPRFDHNPTTGESLGLLVEEQRTNSIRNNTGVGAVAGTPGTLPTNWAATTPANGIAREIVGTGTEDGISYIDVKFSGTNTLGSSFYMDMSFDSGTIAAAQGQTWTETCYVKLIAGSLTGAGFSSTPRLILYGGPGFADNTSTPIDTATNARLATQRYVATRTYAVATTNAAVPRLGFTIATGGTIDFTLRIGLPQLERGAFATSVIPTTTATVTRAADVASITGTNFSSWYNNTEGTFVTDAILAFTQNAGNPFTFGGVFYTTVVNHVRTLGNVTIMSGLSNSLTSFSKTAVALKSGDFAIGSSGSITGSASTVYTPTGTQWAINSSLGSLARIKRLTYYPVRLPDATLQALTAS